MKGILLMLMLDTINPKREPPKPNLELEEKSPEVGWEFPLHKRRSWEIHQWGIYNMGWGEELGLSLYIPIRKSKPKRKP